MLAGLSAAIKTAARMGPSPRRDAPARLHDRGGPGDRVRLLRTYQEREPEAGIETEEYDFSDPTAGLRDNQVHAAVVRPPLGLPGLVSVELATERLVASLPEDHRLAGR